MGVNCFKQKGMAEAWGVGFPEGSGPRISYRVWGSEQELALGAFPRLAVSCSEGKSIELACTAG